MKLRIISDHSGKLTEGYDPLNPLKHIYDVVTGAEIGTAIVVGSNADYADSARRYVVTILGEVFEAASTHEIERIVEERYKDKVEDYVMREVANREVQK